MNFLINYRPSFFGRGGSQAQHVMHYVRRCLTQLSEPSDPHTNDAFTHIQVLYHLS